MAKAPTCRVCGVQVPARQGPGRRARYCSVPCRRAVEYARRRWDRQDRQTARFALPRPGRSRILVRLYREAVARQRQRLGKRP